MDPMLRCQYQSSSCPNERAIKENGQLHKLCVFHRDKANETQRLWQRRHRGHTKASLTVEAAAVTEAPYRRRSCAHLVAAAATLETRVRAVDDDPSPRSSDLVLEDEEIQRLTDAVVDYSVRTSSESETP